MKFRIFVLSTLSCLLLIGLVPKSQVPVQEGVKKYLLTETTLLTNELENLVNAPSFEQMRMHYINARRHYKHVEFYIEFVSPRDAKYAINGPLVPKFDPEFPDNTTYMQGFQRLEELLFGTLEKDVEPVKTIGKRLITQLGILHRHYTSLNIIPSDILEMQQLQLYRMAALNLNGYDATFLKNNVTECEWNMEGMEKVLSYYEQVAAHAPVFKSLMQEVQKTKTYLHKHKDYDSFERLPFIVSYINPLNEKLTVFHDSCGYGWNRRKQALDLRQGFLFGKESLVPSFFSIYYADTAGTAAKADLGKLLFFDPVLSGNNSRSCASCHRIDLALTDGMALNHTMDGNGSLTRNTPTLWNVMYQQAFFYDGRANRLEQQIVHVLHSKEEMNSDLDQIVTTLKKSAEYKKLFRNAFANSPDSALTEYAVKKSLAEFEKTLVALDSRFDHYLRGDKQALTSREINGYNLFAGKSLCGSCHFFPLFNGTVPPAFTDTEYEILGTPSSAAQNELDKDQGRYTLFHVDHLQHAFKTPGLRNVNLTAPYMHNGIYQSLDQVLDFYNAGGGKGLGFDVPNQTLPFDSLQLTAREKEDIILFLKSLEDRTTIVPPATLPSFEKDPLLNKRKAGGVY